jgi:hypothetical protein
MKLLVSLWGSGAGFAFSLREPGPNWGQLGHCVLQPARAVTRVTRADEPHTACQHDRETRRFHCYVSKEKRTEDHATCVVSREIYTELGRKTSWEETNLEVGENVKSLCLTN